MFYAENNEITPWMKSVMIDGYFKNEGKNEVFRNQLICFSRKFPLI